jgi:hypothetical protein
MDLAATFGLFLLLLNGADSGQISSLFWSALWPPSPAALFFLGALFATWLAIRNQASFIASAVCGGLGAFALSHAVAIAGAGPGWGSSSSGDSLPQEYVGVGYGPGSVVAAIYILALVGFLYKRADRSI